MPYTWYHKCKCLLPAISSGLHLLSDPDSDKVPPKVAIPAICLFSPFSAHGVAIHTISIEEPLQSGPSVGVPRSKAQISSIFSVFLCC